MLAPGGRVEKLVERELIEAAAAEREAEIAAHVKGGAILAGQFIALSLGAPFEAVAKVTEFFGSLEGGEDDGG